MQVNWRYIAASRNTYAVLYAACEREGYLLSPVESPASDVTCYSLNSLNEGRYRSEIASSESITIVGGPHASACPALMAEIADYVVVGEGEFTLPALLSSIEEGRPPPPGVATRSGYSPADRCVLLDAYPSFSRMKGYVEISRGCPFRCAYCQTPRIFGPWMRHRTLDSIGRDAAKFRDARFVTPNALAYGSDGKTPRLSKVEALLSRLGSDRHRVYFGTFPSEVRPEFVTDRALELVQTFCANESLHFGAQSGSSRVLRELDRGHGVEEVVDAVERCRAHGFTPVVDFIVGLPSEEEEDQRATAALAEWVTRAGKAHVHRFIPLPGTPLAGSLPRPLLPETRRLFGSLALKGKLTGSWDDPKTRFFSEPFE
jgi:B12-binding domain/radical SAM domain protein